MADGVYRVTEVIGVSEQGWEAAARNAVETAAATVRDIRVAEVIRQDVTIETGSREPVSPRAHRPAARPAGAARRAQSMVT